MENINVCIRIRPINSEDNNFSKQTSLFKVEGSSIINLKSKDILTYGNSFNIICR